MRTTSSSRSFLRGALMLAGGLAATAVAASCGSASVSTGGASIEMDNVKSALTSKINEQVPAGTPSTVTCPDSVTPQTGGTFTCQATVAGQPFTFNVTQKNDQGSVTFVQDRAILQTVTTQTKLDPLLAEQLGGTWQTECAAVNPTVIVSAPGSTFQCSATGTGGKASSGTVTVTTTNVDGAVDWTFN